jgi:hypothetical protein
VAVTDLLTLAEAKGVLRIASSDEVDDQRLISWVTAVSLTMDRQFGRMVQRAVTGEVHDGTPAGPRPLGYRNTIRLRQTPVASFTSVVEYDLTDPVTLTRVTPGVDPSEGYVADLSDTDPGLFSGVLRRWAWSGWTNWGDGGGNIVVSYTAGRYTSTATVDDRVKEAAGILLTHMWRTREPSVDLTGEYMTPTAAFPGYAIPNVVRQMLSDMYTPPTVFGFA